MKTCSKCKIEKSFDDFYKNKGMKDGYLPTCKDCVKLRNLELKKNPIMQLEKQIRSSIILENKLLKRENKKLCSGCKEIFLIEDLVCGLICRECDIEKSKKYRENNKEKMKDYLKDYHEKNKEYYKERHKEYSKDYYEKNKEHYKERHKEYSKDYYEKNKEHYKEHREKNKEKKKEYIKNYYEKNKEKKKQYNRQYRLKKKLEKLQNNNLNLSN